MPSRCQPLRDRLAVCERGAATGPLASRIGGPAWLAGLLIYRGTATPVLDLVQLTEETDCPSRLSSRIVMVETELEGIVRKFGILVEQVVLREMQIEPGVKESKAAGSTSLGELRLDELGIYQLLNLRKLVAGDRQAILFPAAENHP